MNEKVSAFLDGELSASELSALLDEMRSNPELRKQFGRYAQSQACLINENGPDVADRVWERLQNEPAILVPGAGRKQTSRNVRRFTAGLAVAATVAGIAVGSLNWLAPANDPSATTLLATSPEQADYVRAGGTRWQISDPGVEDDLNVYLVEHGGYAGSSTMNGMQSYVKVAGYDEEK